MYVLCLTLDVKTIVIVQYAEPLVGQWVTIAVNVLIKVAESYPHSFRPRCTRLICEFRCEPRQMIFMHQANNLQAHNIQVKFIT